MKNMNFRKYFGLIMLIFIHTDCSDRGNETKQGVEQESLQGKEKKWYRGNLHTHSYWSYGDEFPEVIMDWYKSNGYQFVALSDHNTLAEGERWKVIPEDTIYQQAFEKYLEKYGSDWVNYKT